MLKKHNLASQYSVGFNTYTHRGKPVDTVFNLDEFDQLAQNYDKLYSFTVGRVPEQAAHRPDIISNVFYSNVNNWWLLLLVNNENDPFEFFNIDQTFLIPK